ncbi:hypothetical protein BC830DRAFT_1163936 [Chytriomyces sp. MP71]|nr:hypothetical protein BC830DRAFT_1163936 [Chytriomyces sp. MP71]
MPFAELSRPPPTTPRLTSRLLHSLNNTSSAQLQESAVGKYDASLFSSEFSSETMSFDSDAHFVLRHEGVSVAYRRSSVYSLDSESSCMDSAFQETDTDSIATEVSTGSVTNRDSVATELDSPPPSPVLLSPPPRSPVSPHQYRVIVTPMATPQGPRPMLNTYGVKPLSQSPPILAHSSPMDVFSKPPSKVVKAVDSFVSNSARELSFREGDFFYVVDDSHPKYFEVVNPLTKTRGNVPRNYFEVLERVASKVCMPLARSPQPATITQAVRRPLKQLPVRPALIETQADYARPPRSSSDYHPPPRTASRVANHLSPVTPAVKNNISPTSPSPAINRIHISTHFQPSKDIRYHYTLHYFNESHFRTLHRTHDDLWALHVSLLTHFPLESGRKDSARVLPFLPRPLNARDVSKVMAANLQPRMEAYLQRLLRCPASVTGCASFVKFFSIKAGSVDREGGAEPVESGSVGIGGGVPMNADVRVVHGKASPKALNVPSSISFDALLDAVDDKLGMRVAGLDFEDETGQRIPLFGDEDLALLLHTNFDHLLFYTI